ncbi:MAG TPA: chromosomal replication initiator protein DnaA, partial [Chloroflexota bacterium]|nr:chromosomal replication initiator protein DnaA [Chloroflexota bacterium]
PSRATICDRFVPLGATDSTPLEPIVGRPTTAADLWARVVEDLSSSLGPAHVAWLDQTAALTLDHSVLVIGVENDLTRSWIVARLLPAIVRCLEQNGYPDLSIEFRTESGMAGARSSSGRRIGAARRPQARTEEQSFRVTPLFPDLEQPREAGEPKQVFNPAYTFEHFVVGTGNRLAHAAALAVSENIHRTYNPLFIHGGVGIGKTHLLQAIGSRWTRRGQVASYITSETFTNELIASIRGGSTGDFRRRYREIDILLIDDVHFISGKDSTQEEFFHTFDALYNTGKQIVLSGDRDPRDMRTLEERLRSRFSWGLIADIQPPDEATRLEIIRNKAAERGRTLDEAVLELIASQPTTNVRELEGLLNRLLALSDIHGIEPDLQLATSLIHQSTPGDKLRPDDVLKVVATYFRVTPAALSGPARSREVTLARHVVMYLLRETAEMSLPGIGDRLGGRDHSTVIYGCDRIKREVKTNAKLRADVDAIRGLLSGRGAA